MASQEDRLMSVELEDINRKLSCPLCKGYLIDCVAAEECGHVYCRSCIMRHISNGVMTCPQCHQYFNPDEHGEPFRKLRQDYAMQRLVYKLVPGLLSRETERRARYLNSEQEARTQIRLSTGGNELFFNERSKVSVQLRRRNSVIFSGAQREQDGKLFLRTELSTPLSVIADYLKLRMCINSKCKVLLSEDATSMPLPESFRLIELAYLTKWDKTHPLSVYYEPVMDSGNQYGLLQPSTPMLASESNSSSSSNEPANNRQPTGPSALTAGVLHYAPVAPATNSKSRLSSSDLKIKFNKNHVGRWRLASNGLHRHLHNSHQSPMKTITVPIQSRVQPNYSPNTPVLNGSDERDFHEVNEMDKSRIRLLLNLQPRNPAVVKAATKIAKVLPLPTLASLPASSLNMDEDFCKDPASSLLYNTGLVPACDSPSAGRLFN